MMQQAPKFQEVAISNFHRNVDSSRVVKPISDNLASKYNDADFNYNQTTNSSSIGDAIKEWLKQLLSDMFSIPSGRRLDDLVNTVINWFGLVLLAIAIFVIVKAILKHKGSWFIEKRETDFKFDFATANESTEENLETVLEASKSHRDYRIASRVLYLLTIKKLAERGDIQYDPEKTNRDLKRQIQDFQVKKRFEQIVYVFENVWYGEKQISEAEFLSIEKAYHKLTDEANG